MIWSKFDIDVTKHLHPIFLLKFCQEKMTDTLHIEK